MKEPPKAIWLQLYGDEPRTDDYEIDGDTSWCTVKINDSDIRYVIDKRHRPKRKKAQRQLLVMEK